MKQFVLCVLAVVVQLSGCATTKSPLKSQAKAAHDTPQWYPQYQGASEHPADVIDTRQITALTDKQKQAFRTWYQYPSSQKLTPAEQVAEFLQQSVWGFDFRGDTLVASHAMEENAGNCLSLALLTAALADEVGVRITFQEDISRPVYKQKGSLMLMAKHVRATLRDSAEQLADKPEMTPQTIDVDYFSGRIHGEMVDRQALLAMYYRNKAAEALAQQHNQAALAYAEKAWQLNKQAANSINLMAVVLGRNGQDAAAGEFYRYAIEHRYDNLMLRENYVAYLTRLGREEQASAIADNLDEATDDNPYNWIWRAHQAIDDRHFELALRLFYKAKAAAPYLVESYHGIAQVFVETGRFQHATEALEQAVDVAWDKEEKQQYKNKLLVLNAMLETGRR